MNALIKFLIAFGVTLASLLIILPMFMNIEVNTMLAMMFSLVAAIIGFVVVLKHKKVIHGGHAPFVIGLLIMIIAGGMLYGAIEFTYGETIKEKYWNMTSEMVTILVITTIAGFLLMVAGLRQIYNNRYFWGMRK